MYIYHLTKVQKLYINEQSNATTEKIIMSAKKGHKHNKVKENRVLKSRYKEWTKINFYHAMHLDLQINDPFSVEIGRPT